MADIQSLSHECEFYLGIALYKGYVVFAGMVEVLQMDLKLFPLDLLLVDLKVRPLARAQVF